jgi:integrase
VDGFLGNREIRQSLKTQNWEKAQEKVRGWEADGKQPDPRAESEPTTIERAWEQFLADARARNLRPPTLSKYWLLRRRIEDFAQRQGLRFLREFDLAMCRSFRAGWLKNLAALKTLERLRAFFRFAQEEGWISDNPARRVKKPNVSDPPTMPFTRAEMSGILTACDVYHHHHPKAGAMNALRLRALVLLLRYSGLRIRDAVTLERERITNGKLFLYQAKTGTAVFCPLPPFVVEVLEALPREQFFFWSGQSQPKSAVGDWQRTLRRLFKLTNIMRGHAHRFRDTFAVELLLAGVPLERVSVLLGHQSTRVTEKHYAPWVRARQEQLEADVRRTWNIAEPPAKGTPEVHGASSRAN